MKCSDREQENLDPVRLIPAVAFPYSLAACSTGAIGQCINVLKSLPRRPRLIDSYVGAEGRRGFSSFQKLRRPVGRSAAIQPLFDVLNGTRTRRRPPMCNSIMRLQISLGDALKSRLAELAIVNGYIRPAAKLS